MNYKQLPSQKVLHDNFDYVDGNLVWKKAGSGRTVGTIAGIVRPDGYRQIKLNCSIYFAHRLTWMYVHGEDPGDQVLDHINHKRNDNRIENLRLASHSLNQFNRLGVKGYHYETARDKFAATIVIDGKKRLLGRFDTEQAASNAYQQALTDHLQATT